MVDAKERISTWLNNQVYKEFNVPLEVREALLNFTLLWSNLEFKLHGHKNKDAKVPISLGYKELIKHVTSPNHTYLEDNFSRPFEYFQERYTGPNSYTIEALALDKSGKNTLEALLTKAPATPKEKAISCTIITHRLRNNLFHGEKWMNGLEDQQGNFENGALVLISCLDSLAEDFGK